MKRPAQSIVCVLCTFFIFCSLNPVYMKALRADNVRGTRSHSLEGNYRPTTLYGDGFHNDYTALLAWSYGEVVHLPDGTPVPYDQLPPGSYLVNSSLTFYRPVTLTGCLFIKDRGNLWDDWAGLDDMCLRFYAGSEGSVLTGVSFTNNLLEHQRNENSPAVTIDVVPAHAGGDRVDFIPMNKHFDFFIVLPEEEAPEEKETNKGNNNAQEPPR